MTDTLRRWLALQIQDALQRALSALDEAKGKLMAPKAAGAGSGGDPSGPQGVDTIEAAVWGSTLEMLGQAKGGGAGAGSAPGPQDQGDDAVARPEVDTFRRAEFSRTDPLLPPPKSRDAFEGDGWSSDGGSAAGRRSAGVPRQRRLRAAKVAKPPSGGGGRERRGFAGRSASPGGSGFKRTKWCVGAVGGVGLRVRVSHPCRFLPRRVSP